MHADLAPLLRHADAAPHDLDAQIAAAYACDRAGDELRAIGYYDHAWHLLRATVPVGFDLHGFLLGYGSTLKNVARLADSERVLRDALARFPDDAALALFLALTLERAGRPREALAEALAVGLQLAAHDPGVARYARALREYADELRAPAATSSPR